MPNLDDTGLLWFVPQKVKAARGEPQPRVHATPAKLPESDWRPPTEFPRLAGAKRISIDLETKDPRLSELGPGVRRGDGFIAGIAVGRDDGARWYFPMRHEGGDNLDPDKVEGWAREEFGKFQGSVVGANLLYDLDHLGGANIKFPKAHRFLDVQVAEPLLDEHKLTYNLDALSKEYLGEGKDEEMLRLAAGVLGLGQKAKAIKSNLWRLPARYVGPYAEGDVDRPLRILPLQEARLAADGMTELFDVESRLIPLLLAMRQRGVRVDVEGAGRVREQLVKERDAQLKELRRWAGPQAEFMAPDSFAKALKEQGLNVPFTPSTRDLEPARQRFSITKAWMERNAENPMVASILRGRRVNTIITTFIDGHILTHAINGKIHTEFHQLRGDDVGTIGRFSSSNPNLQNIPARDEEMAPLVRGLFLPEDGEEWVKQDQSQMEYRLQAHYAVGPGAREFRENYLRDPKTDYHKFCAEMCGIDPEDKILRRRVKQVNFSKSYGAQAGKLSIIMGCSLDEATRFIKLYERMLPFTVKTFEKADRTAREKGYITTTLGRRARWPLWEPASNSRTKAAFRKPQLPHEQAQAAYGPSIVRAATYTALNRLLQLGNADSMKLTMVKVWESGVCDVLGAPLLTVHDELDYSAPKTAAADRALAECKHIMETALPLRVPVIVEEERGPNWGACG